MDQQLDSVLAKKARRLAGVIVPLVAAGFVMPSRSALAGTGAEVSVVRSPEASDCPDAEALARAINHLTGRRVASTPALAEEATHTHLHVKIRRDVDRYAATIVASGERSGTREIFDVGATCAGLKEALVVSIAIILDGENRTRWRTDVPECQCPACPVVPPVTPSTNAEDPRPLSQSFLGLEAGIGASLALLDTVGPLLSGGATWRATHWSELNTGIYIVTPQSIEHGRGHVVLSLVAGYARLCAPLLGRADREELFICAEGVLGAIHGSAEGYTRNESASRLWAALGPSAQFRQTLKGPFSWSVRGSLVPVLRRESFRIQGVGMAFEPSVLGGQVSLGLSADFR